MELAFDNAVFVMDTSFLLNYKDFVWKLQSFYPIEKTIESIMRNGRMHVIRYVVQEIRDEEFLEWLKNILPKNRYSILSDESVQRALTESVIPAYMRHLKGHYEKESSRNPEFADPFVISYALSVKRRSLLDVIVVSDDDNLCRICSVLKIPCFKWRDFFNHLNTDC